MCDLIVDVSFKCVKINMSVYF